MQITPRKTRGKQLVYPIDFSILRVPLNRENPDSEVFDFDNSFIPVCNNIPYGSKLQKKTETKKILSKLEEKAGTDIWNIAEEIAHGDRKSPVSRSYMVEGKRQKKHQTCYREKRVTGKTRGRTPGRSVSKYCRYD